jgi:hypothetical protein
VIGVEREEREERDGGVVGMGVVGAVLGVQ